MKAYGIREPKMLSEKDIVFRAEKLHIDKSASYVLDKNYFYELKKKDTIGNIQADRCSPMISKYIQPLQLMYFDEAGHLLSFHNNCYVPGFPRLKWNRYGQFDRFVPATTIPLTDTVLSLNFLKSFIIPVSGDTGKNENKSTCTIVLFWCDFMFKQSKELIQTMKKNLKLNQTETTDIFYVNTDNCYLDENFSKQINQRE